MRKFLPVVPILSVIIFSIPVRGQEFSDIDTMSVPGSGGFSGDTVLVSVDLANSFAVAGFEFRIVYDTSAFTPLGVNTTSRSSQFDLFGANLTVPGVIGFFATTMRPQENTIPPGRGAVASMTIFIKQTALPNSYGFIFEDEESDSYDNSLTDTNSVLVIPILVHGLIEVYGGTGVEGVPVTPADFELGQNYPNPFNRETMISFSLKRGGEIDIEIYDQLGRKVATLYSGPANSGDNRVAWDGRSSAGDDLASGIYFYKLRINWGQSVTKRMALLK